MIINQSICYAGYNKDNNLKIGETSHVSDRFYHLKKIEQFTPQVVHNTDNAKANRLLVESIAREVINKEYDLIGNDHFKTDHLSDKERQALIHKVDKLYEIIETEKESFIQNIINKLSLVD